MAASSGDHGFEDEPMDLEDAWESQNAGDMMAMLEAEAEDAESAPAGTQRSGITELFQSKPKLGGTSSLFFDDEEDDDDDENTGAGYSSRRKPRGAFAAPLSQGSDLPHTPAGPLRRSTSRFRSSPPGFTSPTFRPDQPVPMPSDWGIVHARRSGGVGQINSDSLGDTGSGHRRRRSIQHDDLPDDLDMDMECGLEFEADARPGEDGNRLGDTGDRVRDPIALDIQPLSKRPRTIQLLSGDREDDLDNLRMPLPQGSSSRDAALDRRPIPPRSSTIIPQQPSAAPFKPRLPAPLSLSFAPTVSVRRPMADMGGIAQHDYSRPPVSGKPHMTAVTSSGTTLFFPKKTASAHESSAFLSSGSDASSRRTLLTKPIHRLMEDVTILRTHMEMDRMRENERAIELQRKLQSSSQLATQLWVDKYAPRMYVDLVGDERVHRDVLTWVKQWDYCVFRKPVKRPFVSSGFSRFDSRPRGESFMGTGSGEKQKDSLQRPERRIMLLTGPPGLGKTTLAHIVARHAGYNVVEINASDDRTGQVLQNKLEGAIECRSVMGNRLPNLVIIDEIDGASASGGDQTFVKILVNLAMARGSNSGSNGGDKDDNDNDSNDDDDDDGDAPSDDTQVKPDKAKKKKKRVVQQLRRPIICICNDQYAPVLRPLRMMAQVFEFRPANFQTLAKRLREICEWEGLQADLRATSALCEMTQGDMRSAINTLQFLHGRAAKVTKEMVVGMDVGGKDMPQNVFRVLDAIFTAQTGKSARKAAMMRHGGEEGPVAVVSGGGALTGRAGSESADKYVNRLAGLIRSSGDTDRIIQGCFENYPNAVRFDSLGVRSGAGGVGGNSRLSQAAEIASTYDLFDTHIVRRQRFELAGYEPFFIVHFHRLFANSHPVDMMFPRAEMQVHAAKKESEAILRALFGSGMGGSDSFSMHALSSMSLPPSSAVVRYAGQGSALRTLLLPFLLAIVSPVLRPANIQLLKPDERAILDRIASLMTEFGLRLVQRPDGNGQYVYALDPPINSLLVTPQRTIADFAYPIKQLIASEIALRGLRAASKSINSGAGPLPPKPVVKVKPKVDEKRNQKTIPSSAPIVPAALPTARDLFGRPIVSKRHATGNKENNDSSLASTSSTSSINAPRAVFKFNEGFTNAVRTPILVRDLMGDWSNQHAYDQ